MHKICLTAAFGLLVSSAGAAVAATDDARPDIKSMSIKEIRIHNASLEPKDPNFIVCKRSNVTGSLAKRERTCLTNEEWKERANRSQEWLTNAQDRSRTNPNIQGD